MPDNRDITIQDNTEILPFQIIVTDNIVRDNTVTNIIPDSSYTYYKWWAVVNTGMDRPLSYTSTAGNLLNSRGTVSFPSSAATWSVE
jgi:hypothetical protein